MKPKKQKKIPDQGGHFGVYGVKFAPETLMPALTELEDHYAAARKDRQFRSELDDYLRNFVGRPTPLYFAQRLTKKLGGAKIYLKREDLCHTGAHKINKNSHRAYPKTEQCGLLIAGRQNIQWPCQSQSGYHRDASSYQAGHRAAGERKITHKPEQDPAQTSFRAHRQHQAYDRTPTRCDDHAGK